MLAEQYVGLIDRMWKWNSITYFLNGSEVIVGVLFSTWFTELKTTRMSVQGWTILKSPHLPVCFCGRGQTAFSGGTLGWVRAAAHADARSFKNSMQSENESWAITCVLKKHWVTSCSQSMPWNILYLANSACMSLTCITTDYFEMK